MQMEQLRSFKNQVLYLFIISLPYSWNSVRNLEFLMSASQMPDVSQHRFVWISLYNVSSERPLL